MLRIPILFLYVPIHGMRIILNRSIYPWNPNSNFIRVNLGVKAVKKYCPLPKSPKLIWFGWILWLIYHCNCWSVSYRLTRPHVTYTNWALFCAVAVAVGVRVAVAVLNLVSVQSQSSLSEPLPRAAIFLIVKLRRGFSHVSFVYVLFPFSIFLITYFCVVSSFEPPLDHNSNLFMPNPFNVYLIWFVSA